MLKALHALSHLTPELPFKVGAVRLSVWTLLSLFRVRHLPEDLRAGSFSSKVFYLTPRSILVRRFSRKQRKLPFPISFVALSSVSRCESPIKLLEISKVAISPPPLKLHDSQLHESQGFHKTFISSLPPPPPYPSYYHHRQLIFQEMTKYPVRCKAL